MNFRLQKQPVRRQRTQTYRWKSVCFALRQSNEPYVGPSASSSAVSYLGAGQFGLGEHQGGGVDGVSQLLLHQLVGLGCLADPGEDEGGKKKKKSSTWEGLQLLFFWHNHGDYSNKLSRPVDGTKKLDSFSAVSAPDADNKEYRLSNRQNHPSFQDHNGSPLWLFHNFTHVIKIFMVLIVESCNKPTEPERRREVLWGTQTGL